MKLAIATAFHFRPEVSKLFLLGIDRLRKVEGIEVRLFAAITKGDKANAALLDSAEVTYTVHDNRDLGAKFNLAFSLSRPWKPDAVMVLGSDDLVSDQYIREVENLIGEGWHYILPGSTSFHYVKDRSSVKVSDPVIDRVLKFGAGRTWSAVLLDTIGWKPWPERGMRRSLATASHNNTTNTWSQYFIMDDDRHHVLDVKAGTNIWGRIQFTSTKITAKEATWFLGNEEKAAIRSLSYGTPDRTY